MLRWWTSGRCKDVASVVPLHASPGNERRLLSLRLSRLLVSARSPSPDPPPPLAHPDHPPPGQRSRLSWARFKALRALANSSTQLPVFCRPLRQGRPVDRMPSQPCEDVAASPRNRLDHRHQGGGGNVLAVHARVSSLLPRVIYLIYMSLPCI